MAGKPILLLHPLDARKGTEITRQNIAKNKTTKHLEIVDYCTEITSYAHKWERIQKRG